MSIIDAYGMRGNVVFGKEEREEGKDSLVFIHGAGGNWTSWYLQRDYFSRDFNCFIMELPGHGAAQSQGAQEVKSYALWIMGALEELEVSNPVVIGHSMGGAVAMDLALRFPPFPKALILVGTGAKLRILPRILDEIKENFVHAVESVCQIIFAKDAPKEMLQVATAEMLKTSPDVLHGDFSACDRFDIMEEVGEIKTPTLIICGDQDALTPIKYSRYLAERISGSRLEVIEGAGHMVMLERPEQFNKKVETFVRSVGAADA
jgi:pimeloyl-ACP methyl ester carboxylesterase